MSAKGIWIFIGIACAAVVMTFPRHSFELTADIAAGIIGTLKDFGICAAAIYIMVQGEKAFKSSPFLTQLLAFIAALFACAVVGGAIHLHVPPYFIKGSDEESGGYFWSKHPRKSRPWKDDISEWREGQVAKSDQVTPRPSSSWETPLPHKGHTNPDAAGQRQHRASALVQDEPSTPVKSLTGPTPKQKEAGPKLQRPDPTGSNAKQAESLVRTLGFDGRIYYLTPESFRSLQLEYDGLVKKRGELAKLITALSREQADLVEQQQSSILSSNAFSATTKRLDSKKITLSAEVKSHEEREDTLQRRMSALAIRVE